MRGILKSVAYAKIFGLIYCRIRFLLTVNLSYMKKKIEHKLKGMERIERILERNEKAMNT